MKDGTRRFLYSSVSAPAVDDATKCWPPPSASKRAYDRVCMYCRIASSIYDAALRSKRYVSICVCRRVHPAETPTFGSTLTPPRVHLAAAELDVVARLGASRRRRRPFALWRIRPCLSRRPGPTAPLNRVFMPTRARSGGSSRAVQRPHVRGFVRLHLLLEPRLLLQLVFALLDAPAPVATPTPVRPRRRTGTARPLSRAATRTPSPPTSDSWLFGVARRGRGTEAAAAALGRRSGGGGGDGAAARLGVCQQPRRASGRRRAAIEKRAAVVRAGRPRSQRPSPPRPGVAQLCPTARLCPRAARAGARRTVGGGGAGAGGKEKQLVGAVGERAVDDAAVDLVLAAAASVGGVRQRLAVLRGGCALARRGVGGDGLVEVPHGGDAPELVRGASSALSNPSVTARNQLHGADERPSRSNEAFLFCSSAAVRRDHATSQPLGGARLGLRRNDVNSDASRGSASWNHACVGANPEPKKVSASKTNASSANRRAR